MKVKCGSCKKYIDRDTAFKSGLSYYCDNNCLFTKNTIQKSSTKKTSKSPKINSGFEESIRNYIFKRDAYRCRLCGKASQNLVIHHVIYRSQRDQWTNEASNGISLCNQPCHLTIIHGNKKRFQRLALGIIWLREVHNDRHTTIYQLEEKLNELC